MQLATIAIPFSILADPLVITIMIRVLQLVPCLNNSGSHRSCFVTWSTPLCNTIGTVDEVFLLPPRTFARVPLRCADIAELCTTKTSMKHSVNFHSDQYD